MERVKGIEPSYAAWEAAVLPLNYTRVNFLSLIGAARFAACNSTDPVFTAAIVLRILLYFDQRTKWCYQPADIILWPPSDCFYIACGLYRAI